MRVIFLRKTNYHEHWMKLRKMNSDNRNLPEFKKIIELEKISQKQGSGISFDELIGTWKFESVCKKDSDEVDNISSSLLQVLSAKLELKRKISEKLRIYQIKNSISFGLISVIFTGNAYLNGSRPILIFYFDSLRVSIGKFPMFNKSLNKPNEKKSPFFSLIGICEEGNWMCARGRGGGLAIWTKS